MTNSKVTESILKPLCSAFYIWHMATKTRTVKNSLSCAFLMHDKLYRACVFFCRAPCIKRTAKRLCVWKKTHGKDFHVWQKKFSRSVPVWFLSQDLFVDGASLIISFVHARLLRHSSFLRERGGFSGTGGGRRLEWCHTTPLARKAWCDTAAYIV
jgi:hypothetical protein